MSGAIKGAKGQASGPVLSSGLLALLAHSALVTEIHVPQSVDHPPIAPMAWHPSTRCQRKLNWMVKRAGIEMRALGDDSHGLGILLSLDLIALCRDAEIRGKPCLQER